MKKYIVTLMATAMASIAFAQTENIRFTARRNPAAANQIQVYAKNITSTAISGILGSSNLTVCIAFPKIYSASCVISTPISGQSFDNTIFRSIAGVDSIYAWNGLGSTAAVVFASGQEVNIANISFLTGFPNIATVKLYNAANGGPNDFEYNYIAPNGIEQCSYKNPFYSNIASDPLLVNANGSNDAFTQGNSYIGIANVSLPVKFTSFLVSKKEDNALLKWSVESEDINTLYYDVQTSTDGRSFSNLTRVNVLHNGQTANTYNSTDANISRYNKGIIYYRILQTDASGTVVYSDIKQVSVDKKLYTIGLFPNPAYNSTKLVVEAAEAGNATIVIRDMSGKTVQQLNMPLARGNNQQIISTSLLAAGEYHLTITAQDVTQTLRLIKIK